MEAIIWTFDPANNAYIAVAGEYRCRVWREYAGTWVARVIHQVTTVTQEDFCDAEAAMVWCDDYVQQAA